MEIRKVWCFYEQSTRERSLMSKEFAYNFINQYILGIR